jgi:hypothetical protein
MAQLIRCLDAAMIDGDLSCALFCTFLIWRIPRRLRFASFWPRLLRMKLRLSHRKLWPALLAFLLLFAQVATAAHACAMVKPAPASMHNCHEQGEPAPLCIAHCDEGTQTLNQDANTTAHLPAAAVDTVYWATGLNPTVTSSTHLAPTCLQWVEPPGAPPRYLALLVLRR